MAKRMSAPAEAALSVDGLCARHRADAGEALRIAVRDADVAVACRPQHQRRKPANGPATGDEHRCLGFGP